MTFILKKVWNKNNVCILSNVIIGDGVIVGANSVVTHDIPSYSIAAGIPAKIIKKNKIKKYESSSNCILFATILSYPI